MKIVNRQTFLQMPKGTVFCKFPILDSPNYKPTGSYRFGISVPSILDDTFNVDFLATEVGDLWPVKANDSEKWVDTLMEMQSNLGLEIPFEHCSGRDGLFEDDSVGFAIYSREEVQEMIDLLQQALNDGYGKHTQG